MMEYKDYMQTDRHQCFKSGNIPKTGGGQINLNFVTVSRSPRNSTDNKNRLCRGESTLQGACLCLHPTTVISHVVIQRSSPLPQFVRNVGGN